MKKIILSITILITSLSVFSQSEILRWKAGSGSIDFSQPTSLSDPYPALNANFPVNDNPVGYSLITDSSGNVAFYINTNETYYDQSNGIIHINEISDILNINDNKQAVMLIGNKDTAGFIFTSNDTLYSISNINSILNGTKNSVNDTIATSVSPKITGYYIDTSNFAILTHYLDSKMYYIITPDGYFSFNGQVKYGNIGSDTDTGFFKLSSKHQFVAASYPSRDTIEFAHFNQDPPNLTIIDGKPFNAIEFAPVTIQGKILLYAATEHDIYQIVIDKNDFNYYDTIRIGHSDATITDMQLGVDGKIYVAKTDNYLGVIENPNQIGNCFYNDQGFVTGGQTKVFPNFSNYFFDHISLFLPSDNQTITHRPITFINYIIPADSIIRWDVDDITISTGNTANYTPNTGGLHNLDIYAYWKHNNYIWDSIHIQYPFFVKNDFRDTFFCSSSGIPVTIECPYIDGYSYQWHNYDLTVDTTINFLNTFNVPNPDTWYLKVFDIYYNQLYSDTIVVATIKPIIVDTQDTVTLGDTLYLMAHYETQPNAELNIDTFLWYHGDTLKGNGFTFEYTPTTEGYDSLRLEIIPDTNNWCDFDTTYRFYVKTQAQTDTIINIHDTTICDTTTNFELKTSSNGEVTNITWGLSDGIVFSNPDSTTIHTHLPGTYFAVAEQADETVIIDTFFVRYNLCENIRTNFTVNGNTTITPCENNPYLTLNGQENVINNDCNFTDDMRDFVWDFNDGSEWVYNKNTSKFFDNFGKYHLEFYVIDAKGCEHHSFKNISITKLTKDTVVSSNLPQNAYGEYIVDVDSFKLFADTFPAKRYFHFNPNIRLIYGIDTNFSFNINLDNDTAILPEYIKLGINIASDGNFGINLKNPNDSIIVGTNFNSTEDTTVLFGFPNFNYFTNYQSISQKYFIASYGTSLDNYITQNSDTGRVYYSPDGNLEKYSLYSFIPPLTTFAYDTITNSTTQLKGKWQVNFTYKGSGGLLSSIDIYFPNNIGQISIVPDSIVCKDDFNHLYRTNFEKKMYINSYGNKELNLTCTAYYGACSKEKHLKILFDNSPNTFTPNGDGINDYWLPVTPASNAEIIILNKNGTIVTKFNTKEKPQGWDGNYNNGRPAPNDSYWAIITYSDTQNSKTIKKIVNLIR